MRSMLATQARVLILMMLLFTFQLMGASPREQDDYAYIIELFDMGDHQEALSEMDYFRGSYPSSEFLPYLDYIRANIALKQGDWTLARDLYAPLLKESLHKDVMADVYLNYAIALYNLGDPKNAIPQLLELDLISEHPYYRYWGNVWRGRCYQSLGLLLSAEHEYSKALALDSGDHEIEFEYFKLLLLVQKDTEALAIIARNTEDPVYGRRYRVEWLHYLLYNQRYDDMDEYLAQIEDPEELDSDPVKLLLTRKDLALGRYQEAESRLNQISSSSAHTAYYSALIKLSKGETAQADTIFRQLVRGHDAEIQFLSYLERLKIIYKRDPALATQLLRDYLKSSLPQNFRGQQYILLAEFEFDAGNYSEALRLWTVAKRNDLPADLLDRSEIGIADAYLGLGQTPLAKDNYNRYLNNYQYGRYRDKAFYQIGRISFDARELPEAKQNLAALIARYPNSAYKDESFFLLAEIEYFGSDYAAAIELYKSVSDAHPSRQSVQLRLAQCYYHLERYADAETVLISLGTLFRDYEMVLLEASLAFNRREFETALTLYGEAFNLAKTPIEKQEATSYQAYTLYFLKRFEEASQLFLSLSDLNPSVDSYLFQAARSAYQGRAYKRALDLYDRFVDDYPESPYFLTTLTQIALCYYNLGNPTQAYRDWLNILSRFRNPVSFTPDEISLLREAFSGIQLSLDSMDDLSPTVELMDMIDTFQSEYIRFELSYIIVKLYAGIGDWEETLKQAEEIRRSFPDQKRPELDLLMAESLSRLNQQTQAEELVTQVYAETQSPESLLSLAGLAESTGDWEAAQQKYRELFDIQPTASNWLSLLDISQKNSYHDYDIIWDLGKDFAMDYPQSRVNRIKYLTGKGFYNEAAMMANKILDTETNQFIRAQADAELAMIYYAQDDFTRSASAFKRIRVLYRDYPEIVNNAQFHYILSLIKSGALKEAQLTLWEVQSQLNDDQVIIINDILDRQR
ncbi:MAG: tetratricopeptide repeat protein [Candidatus Cloacimonetes bacterium]|nr:tetratricopeptide repeat protein [Candidatus Cloacimonadota bacterium]